MAEEDWAEEKGLGATATSYPGAAGGQSKGLAVEDTRGSYQTGGSTSNAGTAPSYVNSQFVDVGGPKGINLTEGGFESNDRNNASFNSEYVVAFSTNQNTITDLTRPVELALAKTQAGLQKRNSRSQMPMELLMLACRDKKE
jgi:hypothetical protein